MPINSFENYTMNWKPDLSSNGHPMYLALAELLEEDIRCGKLKPGTKLPPQRELADYLDLNLSTITRAFKICTMKGLITSAVGSGTFVSSDVGVSPLLHEAESELIEMGAILPNIHENQRVIQTIKKVISEENYLYSMQYALPEGNDRQRKAAKMWLNKAGVHTGDSQILLSNGSQNAISAILGSIFERGDTIGTNSLIYPGFKNAAKMLGIKVVALEEKDYELTEDGIRYACKNSNIKGIYLIPDYSNPTTHFMSMKERKMVAELAIENDLIIIEDAINTHMREKVSPSIASFAPENTIHIASISKVFAPALRIAYISVPERFYRKLLNALYCLNISVSMLMIEVATRLIESGDGELIAKERRKDVIHRNELVNQILSNQEVMGDKVCTFRWLKLPNEFSGKSFELCAKSAGVQVFASERFVVGNASYQNAVRLAIPSANQEEDFIKGLYIIKSLLENNDIDELVY